MNLPDQVWANIIMNMSFPDVIQLLQASPRFVRVFQSYPRQILRSIRIQQIDEQDFVNLLSFCSETAENMSSIAVMTTNTLQNHNAHIQHELDGTSSIAC